MNAIKYLCVTSLSVFLIHPELAFANSMAPILPMISGLGWLAMPAIIGIEGHLLRRIGVPHPFRLSLYANLFSALVGVVPAAATAFFTAGPALRGDIEAMVRTSRYSSAKTLLVASVAFTFLGLLFHWWLSSTIEFKFSRWYKDWKGHDITKAQFYRVNLVTYSLLSLAFGYQAVGNLLFVLRAR